MDFGVVTIHCMEIQGNSKWTSVEEKPSFNSCMMGYGILLIVTICIHGLAGQPNGTQNDFIAHGIQPWDDPHLVEQECRKAGCSYPSLCYIPHPFSCFKFIMCQGLESGQIMAQAMSCGFGTMWKAGAEPACDRHDLVDCLSDLCRDPAIASYRHDSKNCRTYWKCQNGKSQPACCALYHSYDPATGTCKPDRNCDVTCPLVNDATCAGTNVQYANVQDGNCRTFWDCENGHPHPVCCPQGQGYDVFKATCVMNPNCLDECPKEYSASCSVPGTLSYDLVDDNCRTYMKCNAQGEADPFCCLPGLMYNAGIKQCVDAIGRACVNANCPRGFNEECRLEAVVGHPGKYKNLDSFGGIEMPCPVGTIFNPAQCNCFPDPKPKKLPQAGCSLDIDAQLPDLKNYGTAVAALMMIGDYGQGEKGVGNMSAYWDGGAGLNIPFYGSQTLRKMYLETRFNPTAASRNKQVLLSSCQYLDKVPTLELSFSQFHQTGGILTLIAKNTNPTFPDIVEIEFPYTFNEEYIFRIIYDGTNMGVFLDNQDPNLSNSAVQPFTGEIQIHIAGLRFTHCRYETNVSGFIGYVKEIKMTKCLTREMAEALTDIMNAPAV